MRSGQLRHRVHLEERVERDDAVGDPIPYWRTWRSVSASIEPIGGREILAEQQIHAVATTRIRIRQGGERRKINEKMRARWRERLFNIEHVDDGSPSEIVLFCSDGLNDG